GGCHPHLVVVGEPAPARQPAPGPDRRRLNRLGEQNLPAGVTPVIRVVPAVPVAEGVPVVAVTGLGLHRQTIDGLGQRQRLPRMSRRRDGEGHEGKGSGGQAAQHSSEHGPLIAALQGALSGVLRVRRPYGRNGRTGNRTAQPSRRLHPEHAQLPTQSLGWPSVGRYPATSTNGPGADTSAAYGRASMPRGCWRRGAWWGHAGSRTRTQWRVLAWGSPPRARRRSCPSGHTARRTRRWCSP